MSMRQWRTGWLATGTLALTIAMPAPGFAQADKGDVVVMPGNQTGLSAPPSVGIGASSPGQSGSAGGPGGGGGSSGGRGSDAAAGGSGGPALPAWCADAYCSADYAALPSSGIGGQGLGFSCVLPQNQQLCRPPNGSARPGVLPPGADAAPSPVELAQQAYERLRLPLPTPRHSPDLRLADGRPATVVGEYTWFWTDASAWRPHTERVEADGVWAEVTAGPVRLSLDPGNGHDPVSCAGPGTPYDRSFGLHAPSPTCDVVYRHSSVHQPGEQVTAVWAITWDVSWTSSTGEGGALPPMTSRAQARFAVAEAQALQTQ